MTIPLVLDASLRYGENPHQAAAFYKDLSIRETSLGGVGTSVVHHGKEMSYNNYLVRDIHLWTCVQGHLFWMTLMLAWIW